jgi:hypothetical protein
LRCEICSEESSKELCDRHRKAQELLKETFKRWQSAMEISWERYLEEVQINPKTGSWVKEVAKYLLKKEKG